MELIDSCSYKQLSILKYRFRENVIMFRQNIIVFVWIKSLAGDGEYSLGQRNVEVVYSRFVSSIVFIGQLH